MALGNWNHTGDYYVSQKFGSDTNDGSASSPFATLEKALDTVNNTGSNLDRIIVKTGVYSVSKIFTSLIAEIIGDGDVRIFGNGADFVSFGNNTSESAILNNIKVDGFDNFLRAVPKKCQVSRNLITAISNAYYSDFYQLKNFLNSRSDNEIKFGKEGEFKFCNFIECDIEIRVETSIFFNCFFSSKSSIKGYSSNSIADKGVKFINCRFQKEGSDQFTIDGETIDSYMANNPNLFINSSSFNGFAGFNNFVDDIERIDLSLIYSNNSPLYLGGGIFAGAHKFAVPIRSNDIGFDVSQNPNPSAPNAADMDAILTNVTKTSDGSFILTNSNLAGKIRSSGHFPVSFPFRKKVNTSVRLGGTFAYLGEAIDNNTTVDRATYYVKIKDPVTGTWLPSESSWYEMEVNSAWQVDGNGLGNGHPQFDISTSYYLDCKEFQVEINIPASNL